MKASAILIVKPAGWHVRARWHGGRFDDVTINGFTHDPRDARVAPIVRNPSSV